MSTLPKQLFLLSTGIAVWLGLPAKLLCQDGQDLKQQVHRIKQAGAYVVEVNKLTTPR